MDTLKTEEKPRLNGLGFLFEGNCKGFDCCYCCGILELANFIDIISIHAIMAQNSQVAMLARYVASARGENG